MTERTRLIRWDDPTIGANDFIVTCMPDEKDLESLLCISDGFHMNFGDERACCIDHGATSCLGAISDFRANAMSREDDD